MVFKERRDYFQLGGLGERFMQEMSFKKMSKICACGDEVNDSESYAQKYEANKAQPCKKQKLRT